MASGLGALSHTLLLFLLLFMASISNKSTLAHAANGSTLAAEVVMRPLAATPRMQSVLLNEKRRRRLGSFQICALCTCCGGPKGLCLPSPCCYAINCNIPNRPFGFCSFTPKACNCFGCHL